ncbi:MAG TPA: hypothetical protein H9976_08345 [Candidatus Akkermansia intestinavium]|nr:hypothetical protein [Candidatus Akkermansia intestinavium]
MRFSSASSSFALMAALLCLPLGAATNNDTKSTFDVDKSGQHDSQYKQFWVGIFDSKGTAQVCVKLALIVSVNIHTYMLDGATKITECTIDTLGNNSIRIYGTGSEQVQRNLSRLSNTRELIDSKTGGATRYPGRKFPEGAYSHNVEFQVDSAAEVQAVYESVLNAWLKNKGCIYKS